MLWKVLKVPLNVSEWVWLCLFKCSKEISFEKLTNWLSSNLPLSIQIISIREMFWTKLYNTNWLKRAPQSNNVRTTAVWPDWDIFERLGNKFS